jgi:hypothetical protein
MESPVTADEADDSYRTLGVGRSSPCSHDTEQSKFARVAEKARGQVTRGPMRSFICAHC